MEEHRLSVPEGWSTEPDFEAAWLDSTRLLRTARFNATGVMARPRFIAGTPVDNPDLTVYSAQREARAPGLADPARAGLDVLEVILPAQMQTDDGTAFNGRVGLWFAWDPGAGRWQLTKFCVYDRPPKALRMPLL
jgi:hypothetical protein